MPFFSCHPPQAAVAPGLDAVLGALRSRGALVTEVGVRPLTDDAGGV